MQQLERSPSASPAFEAGTCRAFVIHNPISGRRGGRLRKVLAQLEEMGCRFVVQHTTHRGHARELAAQVSASEYDRIVVSGGDGTINEVFNGLNPQSPPVAIVPRGTANVLAAEIGLGLNAGEIARTIVHGEPRRVSLGDINGHKFLLMAGVGFDAQVVATVSSRLKRAIGKGAYVLASLQQMIRGNFPRFQLRVDGVPCEAASVVIANAHYYGGKFVCAPAARLESADLQVCLFGHGSRFFVAVYGLALMLGFLPKAPGYRILTATRVEILQPDGAEIQCDGDFIGHTPAVATVTPQAARLVFPR
ncbi:diacylglycerol/lipid kinase family protein [Dongia sp.]|uniref:diacylglycerol/lipid kinase family protein n=1 Tax=Dongia sp. TaxID=1977262 RepID=UPI00375248EB